jgi:GTP:adenosylcobinamide-phosphate guanylyltransferase
VSAARSIVVPAGGEISREFAERIGSPYRALAPFGPKKTPLLQHIVTTLRDADPDATLICVAPPEVAEAINGVDLWLTSGPSGPENIRLGLSHAEASQPALLCTSDLPLITAESVRSFIDACRSDAQVTVGLVWAEAYEKAFPNAPPSEFVSLSEIGPVTLTGLFQIQPDLLVRRSALFDKLFAGRKSQARMAGVVGPKLLWQLATKTLRLSSLTQRAEHLIGGPIQVILDADPTLAYDLDTLDDYTYAETRFG